MKACILVETNSFIIAEDIRKDLVDNGIRAFIDKVDRGNKFLNRFSYRKVHRYVLWGVYVYKSRFDEAWTYIFNKILVNMVHDNAVCKYIQLGIFDNRLIVIDTMNYLRTKYLYGNNMPELYDRLVELFVNDKAPACTLNKVYTCCISRHVANDADKLICCTLVRCRWYYSKEDKNVLWRLHANVDVFSL